MTMPDERRRAVLRTQDFLIAILKGEYAHHYEDLLLEARRCLKHYPSEYYMDEAKELAPEVFGDWKDKEKLTRIEIINDQGREVVRYAKEGHYYRRSVQDDGMTVKYFEEKK